MSDNTPAIGDNPELEALFDSIALQQQELSEAEPNTHSDVEMAKDKPMHALSMYDQIGQLARKMHDALSELGYDKSLGKVANAIPDAKDRLNYIATLTEQSAERVLNAADAARPHQDTLTQEAQQLSERWNSLHNNQLSVEDFPTLVHDTRHYLQNVPVQTQATNAQLLEIIMAQDFQDLTGQVIKKMMGMVHELETELLHVLVEFSPSNKKAELEDSLLNGPIIKPTNHAGIITSQKQVDDLLDSLGF